MEELVSKFLRVGGGILQVLNEEYLERKEKSLSFILKIDKRTIDVVKMLVPTKKTP